MYVAIARKWRPAHFEDLVGQVHVVQTLKNAIAFQRVSHAYLFCGARGVGKTSVARIFAKALRCENAKDAIPCDACTECRAITESRSVDVMEIDGASNNGVEAVRAIRENVAYGAATGYYKIYIIDEVHMLSLSAFNALLKTLEEPPAHIVFIFATTEVQKIPLTILSRCQRFEFRRLSTSQITERLEKILATEPVQLDKLGLELIASHSDGSLRDALSLLDQVLSFHQTQKEPLKAAQVAEALGVSSANVVWNFVSSMSRSEVPNVLKLIEEVYQSGGDLKFFAERALEEIRLLYLVSLSVEDKQTLSAAELGLSPMHWDEVRHLASETPRIRIERMAQILSKAIQDMHWASLPRFVLEMSAIRICHLEGLEQIEAGQAVVEMPKAAPIETKAAPLTTNTPVGIPTPPAPHSTPVPHRVPAPPPRVMGSAEEQWRSCVEAVMKRRPLLGALLSHAQFEMELQGDERRVRLGFPPGSFYEKQALEQKNRSEIEALLKSILGAQSSVLWENSPKASKSLEEIKEAEEARIKKRAIEHPEVQKASQILGAQIVDVTITGMDS